jgi:hypothetical protein
VTDVLYTLAILANGVALAWVFGEIGRLYGRRGIS